MTQQYVDTGTGSSFLSRVRAIATAEDGHLARWRR